MALDQYINLYNNMNNVHYFQYPRQETSAGYFVFIQKQKENFYSKNV